MRLIFTIALLLIIRIADAQIKEIKLGDTVPDAILNNVVLYKDKQIKLSDFKGKPIILDFWATWCAPCVGMLKKTDSIQKALNNEVQFIPITNQKPIVAEEFLKAYNKREGTEIFSVTDEKYFWHAFKHYSIPHYVWIDNKGKVVGLTDHLQITYENIKSFLKKRPVNLKQKAEKNLYPDVSKSLFEPFMTNKGKVPDSTIDLTLEKSDVLWHSTLTKYQGAYKAMASVGSSHILATNMMVERLYGIALGEKSLEYTWLNRWVWNSKNPDALKLSKAGVDHNDFPGWAKDNCFTYELVAPDSISEKETYKIMLDELNAYFGLKYKIKGSLKEVLTDCYVLEETKSKNTFKTSDTTDVKSEMGSLVINVKSYPMKWFTEGFTKMYQMGKPFINNVNYEGRVTLKITGDFKDLNKFNEELNKFGLAIREKKMKIKMVVIEDLEEPKAK